MRTKDRYDMGEISENDAFFLNEYRKTVRDMLREDMEGVIMNRDSAHASIILEEMIRVTKKSFVAITQKMSGDVWAGGLVSLLRERAEACGVSVRILTAERCSLDPSIAPLFNVRVAEKGDPGYNLAVSDGKAYRFENDTAERKAIFCANNPDISSKLVEKFEELYRTGSSVTARG